MMNQKRVAILIIRPPMFHTPELYPHMKYFCVELHYHRPRGHPNRANKVLSAPEGTAIGELILLRLTRHGLGATFYIYDQNTSTSPKSPGWLGQDYRRGE